MEEQPSTDMKKAVSKQTPVNESDLAISTPKEGARPSSIVDMTGKPGKPNSFVIMTE